MSAPHSFSATRLSGVLGALVAGALLSAPAALGQEAQEVGVIEEIVVTGSYIKRAPEDAPSPVRAIGREELEAKGTPQLGDMLMRLPSVIGSENVTAQEQSVGGAGAANINIRNLGLASTLVLLDGKRLNVGTSISNRGEQFVDINRIPFIMVETVEILKDGASAPYGSDAVAGVANFKTRSNFEGFEIQALYQDSFKGSSYDFDELGLPEVYRDAIEPFNKDEASDTDIGAIWGFSNDTTSIVIDIPRESTASLAFVNRSGCSVPKRMRAQNGASPMQIAIPAVRCHRLGINNPCRMINMNSPISISLPLTSNCSRSSARCYPS